MISSRLFTTIILCLLFFRGIAQEMTLDLSGEWTYVLDSLDAGEKQNWAGKLFEQTLELPGTLDDHGVGKPADLTPRFEKATLLQLTRKHRYIGAAWYSREVVVPSEWEGKQISLELERVIWETQVWVDGKKAGMNESIVAPHRFDLSSLLTPGKHVLTIRIDNREKYDVSLDTRNFAHAYTDGTQIIWNGVIGRLKLQARDRVFIDNIQIYPEVDSHSADVTVTIRNTTGKTVTGRLDASIEETNVKLSQSFKISGIEQVVTLKCDLGEEFDTWNEFNPHLYTLNVSIQSGKGRKASVDTASEKFGMRKISRDGHVLKLNNQRIFLRGTLECAIFPLTGYPPMDKNGWKKIFDAARSYGLNHIRFHSWCPPRAAFEAADELGFYLQVELPVWSLTVGKDERINEFLVSEADRIIREYGNHPSFCFWSMGNELQGDFDWMMNLVTSLKKKDKRHLYTTTTFTFEKGRGQWPEPVDDFFVTQHTKKGWVRGQGIFDSQPPDFDTDYSAASDGVPVPLISHEIGQYSIYPNLNEINKYTGVLEPLNFKAIRQDLEKKGLIHLADTYTKASGNFAVQLYKEEIERALKTPEFSGFQLLDLHDFPGQGTALVGILDAFWDSKGLISAEDFKNFCSEVVPLIRHSKATYTNNETFEASVEIANFSGKALANTQPGWTINDNNGRTIASGKFPMKEIPVGSGIDLGKISFPLHSINQASALTITVSLAGTSYKNSWKIWVYPENIPAAPGDVVAVSKIDEALTHLSKGKTVLLNPATDAVRGIEGKFVPVFWSPVHFPDQPGSMGLLVDPAHPALKHFPTETHSDWQWWQVCKNSRPMLLDEISNVTPVIRVVDNFFKNRKLSTLVEARVGKGKLMVCSIDLKKDHPEVRQLKYSVLQYMNSEAFTPKDEISESDLKKMFK